MGEAMAGHLSSEWTAEGLGWQGVSVSASESGSCVCLWSSLSSWGWLFVTAVDLGPGSLAASRPRGSGSRCPWVRGRAGVSSRAQVLPGEKAGQFPEPRSQGSGRRTFTVVTSTDGQHCAFSFSDAPQSHSDLMY